MNTIICDLDGTIADLSDRLYLVKSKDSTKKDWDSFFWACDADVPIKPIISMLRGFSELGYRIIISSGRSDVVKAKTVAWLDDHHVPYDALLMRKDGDYTPDEELKRSWLHQGMFGDKKNILCVLEDRKRVVDMWREEGLTCLQVRDGDF